MNLEVGLNKEKSSLIKEIESLNNQLTQVLLEKSDTIKSGIYIENKYFSILGKYEIEKYNAFFEYEKIRRTIEIYQRALNHQKQITDVEVESIIAEEIKVYQEKLKQIVNDYENAKSFMASKSLDSDEIRRIKEIYRYIVKRIHPDINPSLPDEYKVLWDMTQKAYTSNNLEEMLTIKEILENKNIVKQESVNEIEELKISINNLKEKIDNGLLQISKIKKEYPFNLKDYILNKILMEKKIAEITNETNEIKKAIERLSEHLDMIKFKADGVC